MAHLILHEVCFKELADCEVNLAIGLELLHDMVQNYRGLYLAAAIAQILEGFARGVYHFKQRKELQVFLAFL